MPAINLGALGAAAGIGFVATTISKAVTETVGWAKEMRDLARNLGITTEEASRLKEVGDYWGVSAGAITSALQMAVKRGFQPTIENLAILADKLQGMSNPLDRAALMTETFGKSWSALTPMLYQGGDALRAQAAAVKQGNILMTEGSAKTREYEVAVHEFKESIEALKHSVGLTVITILLKIGILTSERAQVPEVGSLAAAQVKLNQAEAEAERAKRARGGGSADLVRDAQVRVAIAKEELRLLIEHTHKRIQWGLANVYGAKTDYDLYLAQLKLNAAWRASDTALARVGTEQEKWNGFANTAEGVLDRYLVRGSKKYLDGLKAIDEATGSNLYKTYMQGKALEKLTHDYTSGKISLDDYNKGLKDLGVAEGLTPMEKIIADADKAIASVQNVMAELAAIRDKTVTIYVRTVPYGEKTACFIDGTPVNVPWGHWRIERMRVGDRVVVYVPEAGKRVTSRVVKLTTAVRDDLVSLRTSRGEIQGISPNHRFLATSGEFIEVGHLAPGTFLVHKNGAATVLSVVPYPGEHQVHNFEVAHPAHTYLVAGHVVHNAKAEGQFGLDMIVPPGYNENFPVVASAGARRQPPYNKQMVARLELEGGDSILTHAGAVLLANTLSRELDDEIGIRIRRRPRLAFVPHRRCARCGSWFELDRRNRRLCLRHR
ncbi:MAG: Hint domain-containing protein [Chloroflexi bacterium]|nr:Hint domain-containing protein [Chloroflexota bacterium]